MRMGKLSVSPAREEQCKITPSKLSLPDSRKSSCNASFPKTLKMCSSDFSARENHRFYTYLSKVFQGINNTQKQYNWLITDCECYPKNKEIEQLFEQKYCWLSGEELTNIVVKEDFQWIWGCLCGFQKDISLEDVLMHSLPSSKDYNGYYQNPVSLQHPLSSVEIVPSDSSWTLIISNDKGWLHFDSIEKGLKYEN